MALYTEKEDKYIFKVEENEQPVTITINSLYGTVGKAHWFCNGLKSVKSGDPKKQICDPMSLKGKTKDFTFAANNPSEGKVELEIIINQQDGKTLKIMFNDGFTGSPVFSENDENPTVLLKIKFT
jgi:hypothetical protein